MRNYLPDEANAPDAARVLRFWFGEPAPFPSSPRPEPPSATSSPKTSRAARWIAPAIVRSVFF